MGYRLYYSRFTSFFFTDLSIIYYHSPLREKKIAYRPYGTSNHRYVSLYFFSVGFLSLYLWFSHHFYILSSMYII